MKAIKQYVIFRARYFMFIRYAAFHLQQLSAKRQRDNNEQKSIEANKESDVKDANQTEKETKRDTKSQEKEIKDKKQKKEKKDTEDSAKKDEKKEETESKSDKGKDDELLLNENYSEIDTDVAKKIVESITDSICSGDKQESDCKYTLFSYATCI